MNFSRNKKLIRLLSLIAVLVLMTSLFAGCKKDEPIPESTEGSLDLNINLEPETESQPTETETQPVETQPVVNEKSATVVSQLNIRSAPSTNGSSVIGTLYAGDKVIVERRETVTGIMWAYISEPQMGWICMDFVEMDIPDAANNNVSTPAGSDADNSGSNTGTTAPSGNQGTAANTKGVVTTGLNIRKEPNTTSAVVGAYAKGDVVTITETSNGWGRTNKGWIKLQYVNTTGTTNNAGTNTGTTNNAGGNANVSGNGNKTVQFKGVVKVNELNIRSSASTNGTRLGSYNKGARVEFYEKSGNWGRTEKGWISLDYVYQDGTTGTNTATGTITGNGLNVRSGPGTGYAAVGSLGKGDRVSILEQFTYGKTTWGCIKNGWISMDYVDVDGGTTNTNNNNNTTSDNSQKGVVTGNGVNIRSGPGTGYDSVGTLNEGDRVTVTTTQTAGGRVWGKIAQGWVCLDFVDLS